MKYWNEIFKSKNLTKRLFYIKDLISSGYSKYTNLVDVTLGNKFFKKLLTIFIRTGTILKSFQIITKMESKFFLLLKLLYVLKETITHFLFRKREHIFQTKPVFSYFANTTNTAVSNNNNKSKHLHIGLKHGKLYHRIKVQLVDQDKTELAP